MGSVGLKRAVSRICCVLPGWTWRKQLAVNEDTFNNKSIDFLDIGHNSDSGTLNQRANHLRIYISVSLAPLLWNFFNAILKFVLSDKFKLKKLTHSDTEPYPYHYELMKLILAEERLGKPEQTNPTKHLYHRNHCSIRSLARSQIKLTRHHNK